MNPSLSLFRLLPGWLASLPVVAALLLFAGMAHAAHVAAAGAVPLPADGEVPLDRGQVAVLRDVAGTLSLDAVRRADGAGRFTPLAGPLTRGYTTDVYWLRVQLHNTREPGGEADVYWLEVMPSFLDDLRLYAVLPDGTVHLHRGGDRTPASVRDTRAPSPLFRLDLPAGETTIYLRVQTTSSMLAILTLYEPPQLQRRLTTQGMLYGAYFGLLFGILLLNLVNWYLLRDNLFGIYVGYLGVLIVYFMAGYGIVAQYLFPETPAVGDRLVGVGVGATIATGLWFYTRVLGISRRATPVTWSVFVAVMLVGLAGCVGAVAGFYVHVAPLMQYALTIVFLVALPHVAGLLRHGMFEQRLAAASFVLFGVPVIFGALSFAGVIQAGRSSLFAAQLANALHLWLLHFAIARRVRDAELAREEFARQAAVARVEAEQERRRTGEQSRLLAMITHEVRTPLAVIRSALQSLRLVDPQPPAERTTRYERIDRSARRMGMLLELVAAGDRTALVPEDAVRPVDLVALTRQACRQVDPDQESRIVVAGVPDGAMVSASDGMLGVALVNLLDNALKYSPAGSPVTVVVSHAGDTVSWQVDDRGPGIPAADRGRIFDKYWRGSEQSGTPGLGLGLHIVRAIVEAVDGTIACSEAPGGGARFTCTFPAAAVAGKVAAITQSGEQPT